MSEVEDAVAQINKLQRRILEGEDPSVEEMTLVIQSLRSERVEATLGSAKAAVKREGTKSSGAPIDFDAMFAKLAKKQTTSPEQPE